MATEILMPALSPTMTEGNLAKWLKKEGDTVSPGDIIAEIETDKATMEVETIDEGIVGKILVPEGAQNVKVNQLIAVLIEKGESTKEIEHIIKNHNASFVALDSKSTSKEANTSKAEPSTSSQPISASSDLKFKASPLAKRLAQENNINLSSIQGSGPYGRIIKVDILNAQQSFGSSIGHTIHTNREDKIIPISMMRKTIAQRLVESKQQVPHFYLSVDCTVDNLSMMRQQINQQARCIDGNSEYKISVNDIIIKACAMALRDVPAARSAWNGNDTITQFGSVDISVAVALDDGLITPIIFDADSKGMLQISSEMKNIVKRAKANQLKPHEYQGGSFCISNLGMYGIKEFKAIVNPPQACILAVGATEKRPIVSHSDEIKVANVMCLSISCDHRVIDGAVGAELLNAIKLYIEHPYLMLK